MSEEKKPEDPHPRPHPHPLPAPSIPDPDWPDRVDPAEIPGRKIEEFPIPMVEPSEPWERE